MIFKGYQKKTKQSIVQGDLDLLTIVWVHVSLHGIGVFKPLDLSTIVALNRCFCQVFFSPRPSHGKKKRFADNRFASAAPKSGRLPASAARSSASFFGGLVGWVGGGGVGFWGELGGWDFWKWKILCVYIYIYVWKTWCSIFVRQLLFGLRDF